MVYEADSSKNQISCYRILSTGFLSSWPEEARPEPSAVLLLDRVSHHMGGICVSRSQTALNNVNVKCLQGSRLNRVGREGRGREGRGGVGGASWPSGKDADTSAVSADWMKRTI